jgi:cell division protein FtsB
MRDRSRRFFARPLAPRSGGPLSGVPRWVWFALGGYLVYVLLLSDHSILQIMKLQHRLGRLQQEVKRVDAETAELKSRDADPEARRFRAEEIARTKQGWSAEGEIVYRFRGEAADSSGD